MFAESRLHDKRCQLCLDALSLNIADEMTSLFVPFGAYGLAACTCFESLNQERENSAIVLVISEQFRCTGLKVLQSIGCTVSYRLQNLLCPDSQIRVRTTSYENLFLPGRVREQHFRRWPLFDGDGIGCWQRHIPSNLSVTLFQQMYKSRGQRISIVASVENFNHTIEASLIF